METDLEKLIGMLTRAGVVFGQRATAEGTTMVMWEALTGEKNLGYNGFVGSFVFDGQGVLLHVRVEE